MPRGYQEISGHVTRDIIAALFRVICPIYLLISSGPCPGYNALLISASSFALPLDLATTHNPLRHQAGVPQFSRVTVFVFSLSLSTR